jgi:hypothetical protein
MGEVGLLMGKCAAPRRRARFEGISGLAALALEMPQDSINHACISNNGDNLHLNATATHHGIYFNSLTGFEEASGTPPAAIESLSRQGARRNAGGNAVA